MQTYCNNTTAEFGIWFNGKDIVYQHRKREPHEFSDIPDVPRKGESLEDVGVFYKDKLIPATELKSVFETIHNHIYANEAFLKEKVFNEMLKVIFIKMVDEKTAEEKCGFRITERELRKVEDGKGTAFVDRINDLFGRVKKEYRDVFWKNDLINLKPTTIAFVVSQLQKYNLRDTAADVKGTAFQTFV
jgi:type I restriction enzyme M protein